MKKISWPKVVLKNSFKIKLTLFISIILNIALIITLIVGSVQQNKEHYITFAITRIDEKPLATDKGFYVYIDVYSTVKIEELNVYDFSIIIGNTPTSISGIAKAELLANPNQVIKNNLNAKENTTFVIYIEKIYELLSKPITLSYKGQVFTFDKPLKYELKI